MSSSVERTPSSIVFPAPVVDFSRRLSALLTGSMLLSGGLNSKKSNSKSAVKCASADHENDDFESSSIPGNVDFFHFHSSAVTRFRSNSHVGAFACDGERYVLI